MRDWWNNLTEREQDSLFYGGIIALILFFYLIVWAPLTTTVKKNRQQLMTQLQLIQWMQQAKIEISEAHHHKQFIKITTMSALLKLLEDSLTENNLRADVQVISQLSDNSLKLSSKEMAFDQFIAWLDDFSKNTNINIDDFAAIKLAKPGKVQVSLIISLSR